MNSFSDFSSSDSFSAIFDETIFCSERTMVYSVLIFLIIHRCTTTYCIRLLKIFYKDRRDVINSHVLKINFLEKQRLARKQNYYFTLSTRFRTSDHVFLGFVATSTASHKLSQFLRSSSQVLEQVISAA